MGSLAARCLPPLSVSPPEGSTARASTSRFRCLTNEQLFNPPFLGVFPPSSALLLKKLLQAPAQAAPATNALLRRRLPGHGLPAASCRGALNLDIAGQETAKAFVFYEL